MSKKQRGTLYVGVTSDLVQRVWQHKSHLLDGFTKKYDLTDLVYYEQFFDQIAPAQVVQQQLSEQLRARSLNKQVGIAQMTN